MEVTTKELRVYPGRILEQVLNGYEVTITFRGKRLITTTVCPFMRRSAAFARVASIDLRYRRPRT